MQQDHRVVVILVELPVHRRYCRPRSTGTLSETRRTSPRRFENVQDGDLSCRLRSSMTRKGGRSRDE